MATAGLVLLGRAVLAAVLATAGVAKLADHSGTRRSLVEFGFPRWLAPPLSIGVPMVELAAAAALLPAASARAGDAVALVLLTAFSMLVATAVTRGRRVNCRCFGQL